MIQVDQCDARRALPGVGLCYQRELHSSLVSHLDRIDYLEIVPDTVWTDHGAESSPRYVDDAEALSFLKELRQDKPIVSHGIGLSIGSAHRFRHEHLEQMVKWDVLLDFLWCSDHLAFNIVRDPAGGDYLLGVPFPLTLDEAMLELLVERVRLVAHSIAKPFLLENNVTYIEYEDQEYGEAAFLNALCERAPCGVLLDLHNLYVDWRNGKKDVDAYLTELDLSNVVEIHVAGGLVHEGVYLDAHSGRVPEDVWRIAEATVPACPNLRGVTFELLGSWFQRLGEDALLETLNRARALVKTRASQEATA